MEIYPAVKSLALFPGETKQKKTEERINLFKIRICEDLAFIDTAKALR